MSIYIISCIRTRRHRPLPTTSHHLGLFGFCTYKLGATRCLFCFGFIVHLIYSYHHSPTPSGYDHTHLKSLFARRYNRKTLDLVPIQSFSLHTPLPFLFRSGLSLMIQPQLRSANSTQSSWLLSIIVCRHPRNYIPTLTLYST